MWPTDEQIDEAMSSAGKKTSPEWERILGADLADDIDTVAVSSPVVVDEAVDDDPARDIDRYYSKPHPVAATDLAAGMLIDMDGAWVTVVEASSDDGQVILEWESAGDDRGTLMLGDEEALPARTLLDD